MTGSMGSGFRNWRFASLVAGCALSLAAAASPARAALSRDSDSLLVIGVDASSMSAVVGGRYSGLAHVYQGPLIVSSAEVTSWPLAMTGRLVGALRDSGMHVREAAAIFALAEDYSGIRFALAGKVTRAQADFFGMFAGNVTRIALDVRWEVLDIRSRRVVFSCDTPVAFDKKGKHPEGLLEAFELAVQRLVARPELAKAVAAPPDSDLPGEQANVTPSVVWRRELPADSQLIRLGAGTSRIAPGAPLESALKGVVVLKSSDRVGTAFMLTRDGLALTNNHVVEGAGPMTARTPDGIAHAVRVLRHDANTDVALIELADMQDCFTLSLATPTLPKVGTDVFAIGTPMTESLANSVTRGVVGGLRRRGPATLIQTDAAVSPGNSGGPLVEARTGRVLGIVTLKLVAQEVEGLAFAVSIYDALRVLGIAFE